MCGCYYVEDETAREIEKIIWQVDENLHKEQGRDIRPGDKAPILITKNGKMDCSYQKWGFPVIFKQENGEKKQLLFNARCESVLEKPAFKDSVLKRRAVIPATRFYEWSRAKEKNI